MATAKKSYQALSAELDEILAALQTPEVDIDEALKLYERGQKVIAELEAYLTTAENKVNQLKAKFTAAE